MAYGFGKVVFSDGYQDAFGRLRVSMPESQFDSKSTYGVEEKQFKTTTATNGTATFLPNEAAWLLSTTTDNGSRVLRESYKYMQYRPGKSQLIDMTGVFGPAVANCIKRVGYYDDNDGLYFVQNGVTGFGVARRTSTSGSPVDNIVYQTDWNIDKLDGNGASGITLDITKTQIMMIDFQWLGVGMVRFGFVIDGKAIYVHQMNHANNTFTQVYMKSAWLPIRYEIVNTAGTTASTLKQICCSVISEGGTEAVGNLYSHIRLTELTTGTSAWTPLLSIQVGSTLNSQAYRGKIQVTGVQAVVSSQTSGALAIFENPASITGASWQTPNSTSAVQTDVAATAFTGGTNRQTILVAKDTASTALGNDEIVGFAGSQFVVAVRGITGNISITGCINWREIL